jgi:uncharacterized membrane protein YoaK (UPF0700 family)
MTRYDRDVQALAVALAALAGYLDAVGFLMSGGFFVSFMTGNSTRFGVGLAGVTQPAAIAGGLIVAFVAGVCAGSLLGHKAGRHRSMAILLLVTLLLAGAAGLHGQGLSAVAIALLAFAMGAMNAIFERDGDVRLGLTYMTGSLVRVGHGLAGLLLGRKRRDWIGYLCLWAGLVTGAVIGAIIHVHTGGLALWIACALAILAAAAAAIIGPERRTA